MTDLSDSKRFVKTQYAIGLNNTNGKPRCDAAARRAIGNGLWARLCLLANQSGNSEAAKMKSAWLEAATKRAAAECAPVEPALKRLPSVPAVVLTASPGSGAQDGAVLLF